VIICICRGKSDRDINKAIDNGATTVRDLQRCGIGNQCGSCHTTLRGMLARAADARAAAQVANEGGPGCAAHATTAGAVAISANA
jgi:bacterioferritin-associated ferredoxin